MARLPDNQNPVFDSRFLDLSFGDDNEFIAPGELFGRPFGVRALSGNDTVQGSDDFDTINGNSGNDNIFGGGSNDFLRGGTNEDFLDGQSGDDTVNGNNGEDFVQGGDGSDLVRGGQGNDSLFGNNGNDLLVGDFGADDLTGGSGLDTFIFRTDTAAQGVVNADVALDFNTFEGDRIGLDSRISTSEIILDDSADYSNIFGGGGQNDTVISIAGSGLILGVILDRSVGDVVNRIDIISDQVLAQG
ncbi:calcium-binding protein [Pseudanabaena sp. PCC 6802]|uniref:calcium-binding protein n=1 Tax=Pseudanabaena sp. PCC 6802 TaxID=118173 RepID=UPI0003451F89|nr:calcium-binding protein [Pseudanabaena sp. PCC 6802]